MAHWRHYSFLLCLFLAPALPALPVMAAAEVHPAEWPALKSAVPEQADIERSVHQLLAHLTLEEKVGQLIQADIDSVKSVRQRVWGYVFVPALQGNVTVVGVKDLSSLEGTNALERGHDLTIGKHEMLAGAPLAKSLGLVIGDSFGLPSPKPSPPLKLVGTFGSAVDLYAADVVLCDEDDARDEPRDDALGERRGQPRRGAASPTSSPRSRPRRDDVP